MTAQACAKLEGRSNHKLMKSHHEMGIDMSTNAVKVVLPEDTSLTAFYRDMSDPERRTFWACATGWALDGMDFMIYPLVIGTIIALWKVEPGWPVLRHCDATCVSRRWLVSRLPL